MRSVRYAFSWLASLALTMHSISNNSAWNLQSSLILVLYDFSFTFDMCIPEVGGIHIFLPPTHASDLNVWAIFPGALQIPPLIELRTKSR